VDEQIVSLHAGYDVNGRMVDAYLARPVASEPRPGVVLLSGMYGLDWFQRQVTCTFARGGFTTLSPDLLDGSIPKDNAAALLGKNSLDIDLAVDRIAAAADYLRRLPWVGPEGRVGVVGFCMGGGLALLALARTSQFQAGVIYHHSLFPDPRELERIDCKLLCHYGVEDRTTPREEVEAFTSALDRYEKQYEVAWYEGVGHSFLKGGEDSPRRQQAAAESLERSFAFLRQELSG
jgi:carboxymethylenebutenolidase